MRPWASWTAKTAVFSLAVGLAATAVSSAAWAASGSEASAARGGSAALAARGGGPALAARGGAIGSGQVTAQTARAGDVCRDAEGLLGIVGTACQSVTLVASPAPGPAGQSGVGTGRAPASQGSSQGSSQGTSGQRTSGQASMRTFELSRPTVGAQALGIARAAYEYALDDARTRVQFGRPIIENQAIAFALADMRTEIDAARLLVWRAAWMGRNNQPFTAGEGSMSKLKAGEVAVATTEKAIQILGGAGFLRDHPVERWFRDAKIYTIFEGTSEIQRLVIARSLSGLQIT